MSLLRTPPCPCQNGVGALHYSLERVEVEVIELVFAGICGWLIQTNLSLVSALCLDQLPLTLRYRWEADQSTDFFEMWPDIFTVWEQWRGRVRRKKRIATYSKHYKLLIPINVHPKGDQSCVFIGRTDAEAEISILGPPHELTHWKRPWFWEGLGAGEGDNRGWDGWMASPTRWAWVWVKSGSWWWTGRPGVLRFRGPQRVGHDWATELTHWLMFTDS